MDFFTVNFRFSKYYRTFLSKSKYRLLRLQVTFIIDKFINIKQYAYIKSGGLTVPSLQVLKLVREFLSKNFTSQCSRWCCPSALSSDPQRCCQAAQFQCLSFWALQDFLLNMNNTLVVRRTTRSTSFSEHLSAAVSSSLGANLENSSTAICETIFWEEIPNKILLSF